MDGLIKGIHHVNIKASDLDNYEETLKFYTEVLGMEIVEQRLSLAGTKLAMLSAGNCCMEVSIDGLILPQGAIRHVALATDKIEDCVESVRAAGYEVTKGPTKAGDSLTVAFAIGPCGEEIEFYQKTE